MTWKSFSSSKTYYCNETTRLVSLCALSASDLKIQRVISGEKRQSSLLFYHMAPCTTCFINSSQHTNDAWWRGWHANTLCPKKCPQQGLSQRACAWLCLHIVSHMRHSNVTYVTLYVNKARHTLVGWAEPASEISHYVTGHVTEFGQIATHHFN